MGRVKHNPRCAIFNEPPSLRDANDCNCGAIPPLPTTGTFTMVGPDGRRTAPIPYNASLDVFAKEASKIGIEVIR